MGGRLAKVFPAKEYISFLVGYKEFCLLRAKIEEKLDIGSQNPLLVVIVAASKAGFQTDSLAQFHQRCIDLDREVWTKICPDHHLDPEIAWFSLLEDDNVPVGDVWRLANAHWTTSKDDRTNGITMTSRQNTI